MIQGLEVVLRGVLFAILVDIAVLAPAEAGAQLDREAPLATAHGFVGRMTVSPEHGPPGTPVRVSAEGLPAETEFQLAWRTVKGAWKVAQGEYHGREYQPAAFEIATVRQSVRRLPAPGSRRETCGSNPPRFRSISITARPARVSKCI